MKRWRRAPYSEAWRKQKSAVERINRSQTQRLGSNIFKHVPITNETGHSNRKGPQISPYPSVLWNDSLFKSQPSIKWSNQCSWKLHGEKTIQNAVSYFLGMFMILLVIPHFRWNQESVPVVLQEPSHGRTAGKAVL